MKRREYSAIDILQTMFTRKEFPSSFQCMLQTLGTIKSKLTSLCIVNPKAATHVVADSVLVTVKQY